MDIRKRLEEFAIAVIKQAFRDLRHQKPDAEAFFRNACSGGEEAVWFDIAGINPHVIWEGRTV